MFGYFFLVNWRLSLIERQCESVSRALCDQGISSDYYHASREISERQRVYDLWINNRIRIVCATVAFGMVSIHMNAV
jgi:ATP-dependent DNA helicase RecQ